MVGKENQGEKKGFSTLIRKDTQCNFIKLLRELFGKFFILPARELPNVIPNSCQNQRNRHTKQYGKVCFSLEVPPIEKTTFGLACSP